MWDQTNACDVSVDTINSAEDLAAAHFMVPDIVVEEDQEDGLY